MQELNLTKSTAASAMNLADNFRPYRLEDNSSSSTLEDQTLMALAIEVRAIASLQATPAVMKALFNSESALLSIESLKGYCLLQHRGDMSCEAL